MGGSLAVGTNSADAAVDTALGALTHVVVYTKSSLAEQSTPSAEAISDKASTVGSVAFVDKDLDIL